MIEIIQTSKSNNRHWQKKKIGDLSLNCAKSEVLIAIDEGRKFQKIIGFGGAFTEAACFTIMSANAENRRKMLQACFSRRGLNYNLGRISVHSCDFSLDSYTYVEEGDSNLSTFNLSREDRFVIPAILAASSIRGESVSLAAAPWSPPAYMKTNNSMLGGGKLKDEYRQLWADYLARYLAEMKKRGLNIDYLSVQNEPEAKQVWESCLYSGREEADFIARYLHPTLFANKLDVKILSWDHNRDRIVARADETFADEETRRIVWGIAYHWYVSDEHDNLSRVHNLYPEKHLLFTEGCVELKNGNAKNGPMGIWEHGEFYGRNIINDFNNYNEGWIDWNLAVNEIGGPNHVHNYCEAPIIYDRAAKKIAFNPSYYYISHFSRYVSPEAYRVFSEVKGSAKVLVAAFTNPNGDLVAIIQNEGEQTKASIMIGGQGTIINLPAHSITTTTMHDKQRRKQL